MMTRQTDTFSVAAVFSDHCVLQREKPVCVFGTGADGQTVTVTLLSADGGTLRKNTARVRGGRWELNLEALCAQEGLTLTAECGGTRKELHDVAVGEVWLAGGQSNMEFELANCTEGPAELSTEKAPGVRFYYTQKIAWMDDAFFEAERNTAWQTWDSRWRTAWSAVGYFFGKRIASELGVTVGIIGCNWGGTSASAWVSRAHLEKDEELYSYLAEYDEAAKGKSTEEQCREFDEYLAYHEEWQKKCDALYRENPKIEWGEVQERLGICRWPGPKNCKNPYRPTGLYECMLRRVMPYTLKGFIYYQGESDDHKPALYYKLFRELIDQWRTDWHDDTLPFLFVQLPEHRYKQDKDFKNWPLIREAQAKAAATVANTGMVCALGLGEYDDIHPKHKKELAERMARLALSEWYGGGGTRGKGPSFRTATAAGSAMELFFSNADDGLIFVQDETRLQRYRELEARQGNTVADGFTGFELAGADRKFYSARCEMHTDPGEAGRITLTSPRVPEPVYARYAWYNYGPVTVFARNGLPLPPFRTSQDDTGTESTGHADIQQLMET